MITGILNVALTWSIIVPLIVSLAACGDNSKAGSKTHQVGIATKGQGDQLILRAPNGSKLTLGDLDGFSFGVRLEDKHNYSVIGIDGEGVIAFTNNQSQARVRYYGASTMNDAGFTIGFLETDTTLNFIMEKDSVVLTLDVKGKSFRLRLEDQRLLLSSKTISDPYKAIWSQSLKD